MFTLIMENQFEKNMENDIETGIMYMFRVAWAALKVLRRSGRSTTQVVLGTPRSRHTQNTNLQAQWNLN